MSKKGKKVESCIYQQPDGKYLVIANIPYVNINGKKSYRRPESTFTSRAKARFWLKEQKAKSVLGLSQKEKPKNVSIGEIMDITRVEKSKFKHWDGVRNHWKVIGDYFGYDRELCSISRANIISFREWLSQRDNQNNTSRKLAPATVNRHLQQLRWIFNYAEEERMVEHTPKIRLLKEDGTREYNIDLDDFLKVLEFLPQHKAMLLVALNTGARATDLFNMRKNQLVRKEIRVNGKMIKKSFLRVKSTKTRKDWLEVPLLKITEIELQKNLKDSSNQTEWMFLSPRTRKPLRGIQASLDTAIEKAGISRFTMHVIRHLATSVLFDLTGGDYHKVKNIIGWSDEVMADRYGHLGVRHIATYDQFDELLEGKMKMLFPESPEKIQEQMTRPSRDVQSFPVKTMAVSHVN